MANKTAAALKSIQFYLKNKPNQFDGKYILSKMQNISVSDNKFRGILTVDSSMCNSVDALHGGFASSIIDTASTLSLLYNSNKLCWTLSMQMNFLKPAMKDDVISVQTNVLRGGSQPVVETTLTNEATGATVAKAVLSFVESNEKFTRFVKESFGLNDVK